MNDFNLLLLPIIFPIICGLGVLAFKKTSLTRKNKLYVIFAALFIEAICIFDCLINSKETFVLLNLADNLEISFHVDMISCIFSGLVAVVWLLVGCYAFEYAKHLENEERFFGFYLMAEGMLVALCFSNNLITFYAFFEMMTLSSLALVLHELTHSAIMAGLKYLFYSVAGAFAALFGIFFLSLYGGLGSFNAGGILDSTLISGNKGIIYASSLLLILGFGTKAGMFPMHGWLPTAHPQAPAPASAVLSGVITKMGVLGIVRAIYFVVGPDILRDTYVQYVWLILSLITVLMGSMMAYREKNLKKRLAYSTVSQVSYMLFGLALFNKLAFVGAIAHLIFHSMVKNTLFMNAGAIIYKTGKTKVDELNAIGKQMPISMWCFTLVSITLIGIPPTSGFISKWYLATGSLSSGINVFSWLGPVILLISALLTAGYLLPITIHGFFPGADFDYSSLKSEEPSALMYIPMIIMTVISILLGMFPGILTDAIMSVANMLF